MFSNLYPRFLGHSFLVMEERNYAVLVGCNIFMYIFERHPYFSCGHSYSALRKHVCDICIS